MRFNVSTLLFFLLVLNSPCDAQELPASHEQLLENLASIEETETEDDYLLQQLDHLRKNPVNINKADINELAELTILSDLQIGNLIRYRRLLGPLLSLYELQAVPSWDVGTIRKLLPFISATPDVSMPSTIKTRLVNGVHGILFRFGRANDPPAVTPSPYLGDPHRIYFRYKYTFRNLLQYGIVGDKDSGEQFLKGEQKLGFDFYSFHLFARRMGIIHALAIGDFTVNMGQGLIQWQGMGAKKSVDVIGIKRQSPVLRPYNSAGEFFFQRGVGITIKKYRFEGSIFASVRKLTANLNRSDLSGEEVFTSFNPSGYHRTINENLNRQQLGQTSFGSVLSYRGNGWHLSLNNIYYRFSLPIEKRDEPYNLFAIEGDTWYNLSIDYSYTHKNIHFFGEVASDKNFNTAYLNGLQISVDTRADISFLQRSIAPAYQAVYANAFTENSNPVNETGFYFGINLRPVSGWRIDAYADFFVFPWIKYRVDAPSQGSDFFIQVTYTPNKQVEWYTRFRNEKKPLNHNDGQTVFNHVKGIPKQNWRTHLSYKINSSLTIRNRIEILWYDYSGKNKETGYAAFADLIFKPMMRPYSVVLRLQHFETGGYNSRIYAYENDVLYSYSIPANFNKGSRAYVVLNYDIRKNLSMWIRLARTISREISVSQLSSNKQLTEFKLQFYFSW